MGISNSKLLTNVEFAHLHDHNRNQQSQKAIGQNPQNFLPAAMDEAFRSKKSSNKVSSSSAIKLEQFENLLRISACSMNLSSLSPNIAILTRTTKLQLCCNNLQEIPAEIGYMSSLTSLSLAKNELTFLPESIGLLTNLTELKLSRNKLTTLPVSIKNLTNLVTLKIARNNFTTIPSELGNLKQLICLDLSHNKLISLPVEISRLKYLKQLKIENLNFDPDNPTPSMTVSTFPTLKELSSRLIIKRQIPIYHCLNADLKNYLRSSHSCAFCEGPYFDSYISKVRIVIRNEVGIPFEDRLCVNHYQDDLERLKLMFCNISLPKMRQSETRVDGLKRKNLFSIKNFGKYSSPNEFSSINDSTIPLSSLYSPPLLPSLPENLQSTSPKRRLFSKLSSSLVEKVEEDKKIAENSNFIRRLSQIERSYNVTLF